MIPEYDRLYTEKPTRWVDDAHDKYIFDIVSPGGDPDSLLDVGCGNGHTIAYFQRYWKKAKCDGIDLSSVAVKLAQDRAPLASFTACELGKYEHEPYKLILFVGVLEHFPDPLSGLLKAKSLLRDDGEMYVEVPNCIAYPTHDGTEGFFRVKHGSKQTEWHLHRPAWEEIILKSGLKIKQSITGENKAREFIWLLTK